MGRYRRAPLRLLGAILLTAWPLAAQTQGPANQSDAALAALRSGDAEEAREIWSRLARDGDPAAQSNLAGLYLSGALGEADSEQALAWFRKAAEQDNASALVSLGHIHRTGLGDLVLPDREDALTHFRRAAEQGSAEGAYFAGEMELQDNPSDPAAAVEAIQTAAEAGFPPAMHRIGTFLQSGRFTRKDVPRAVTWYEAAADRGLAESSYRLGEIYLHGDGLPVDMEAALAHFEQAADQGSVEAQVDAGFIHLRGLAGSADPAKAADYFSKAAAQWNYRAMYYLGLMRFEGTGTPQDLVQAHKWFNLAANGGHAEAHLMRGATEARLASEQLEQANAEAQAWFDANHDTPHTHDSLELHGH